MIILSNPFRGIKKQNNSGISREALRELARKHNIPRGRDVSDTIRQLRKAGFSV